MNLHPWLQSGEKEVLVDRLPGYPDGITRVPGGSGFWVALTLPSQPIARLLRWGCARPARLGPVALLPVHSG